MNVLVLSNYITKILDGNLTNINSAAFMSNNDAIDPSYSYGVAGYLESYSLDQYNTYAGIPGGLLYSGYYAKVYLIIIHLML